MDDTPSSLLRVAMLANTSVSALKNAKPAQLRRVLERLQLKLRRERHKGLANHHRYNVNRHIAIKQAMNTVSAWLYKRETKKGA